MILHFPFLKDIISKSKITHLCLLLLLNVFSKQLFYISNSFPQLIFAEFLHSEDKTAGIWKKKQNQFFPLFVSIDWVNEVVNLE